VKTTKKAEVITLDGKGLDWGMGYATRANIEPCLLATRGSPLRLAADIHQVVIAPAGEHSEKPDEVYRRIERLYPGPYLELFARRPRPGWTVWGNEIRRGEMAPPAEPPDPEAEPAPDRTPSRKRRRMLPGHAMLHRRAKLGDELVDKIKGTSLGNAKEMNELVVLNRGAPAGGHQRSSSSWWQTPSPASRSARSHFPSLCCAAALSARRRAAAPLRKAVRHDRGATATRTETARTCARAAAALISSPPSEKTTERSVK
jgi:hypothetical protein